MRKKILAANWKMHKTAAQTAVFFDQLRAHRMVRKDVEIVIAPSFTSLETAAQKIKGTPFRLAAQNMHWATDGAFTGEISAAMLKAIPCDGVILGHSERRKIFFETDEQINQKIRTALAHQLDVIFCIGETLEERQQHQTESVLKRQLLAGLSGVSKEHLANIVIAYEPVWAIGTGQVASADQAEQAHRFIRKTVWDHHQMKEGSQPRIIYGGSVNPDNFLDISKQPNVDGALVGGASLDPKSFIEILNRMS